MIEARQLNKSFRRGRSGEVSAVHNISLTIERGQVTAFAGPSGSGKTTLLSILGALDRATSGSVLFENRDLTKCSDVELARVRRKMGFVFQDFALLRGLAVRDNIAYPLIPRGVTRSERAAIVQETLERVGMSDFADKRPEELSGGERQRVALARAMAGKPKLLLADEPTSNLDQQAGQEIAMLVQDIQVAGTTVVVVTHDPILLDLASHVFHLEKGRLVRTEP